MNSEQNIFQQSFTTIVEEQYLKKDKRDIWKDSTWKHISELENDDVGRREAVEGGCDVCRGCDYFCHGRRIDGFRVVANNSDTDSAFIYGNGITFQTSFRIRRKRS